MNDVTTDAATVLLPGFSGPDLPAWLAARLSAGLGGVCLFETNVESPEQLRRLTDAIRAANPLALIAIDEEGGDVTRLHAAEGSPYPGNALLGREDHVEYTESIARDVGWSLRRAGVNLDFAPDADINSNPDNPVIGTRSFGTVPADVARHTAAWIRGLQSTGVAASAKHFPGHGDTATDSHLALPVVDQSLDGLRLRELVPFAAAVAAGTRTVMTSHILVPSLDPDQPATFSARILGGLLRDELGFDGVIVTDALDMRGASGEIGIPEAAVRAVAAGCDLLCIGTDNSDEQLGRIQAALESAVADGRIPAGRLADAARRVRSLGGELVDPGSLVDAVPLVDPVSLVEVVETEGGDLDGLDQRGGSIADAIAAFDIRATPAPGARIVALETTANIAVGGSPWGLAAAGRDVISLREGEALPPASTGTTLPLTIVGKDNHRHRWVREFIDVARLRHPSTIVIDMGWPADDRRYADIATFGASRFVGEALAAWLDDATAAGRIEEEEAERCESE